MKKFTKKVLPVLLAGALVAGMAMPAMADADPWSISDVTPAEYTYTIDNKAVDVKVYTDHYLKEGGIGKATGSIQQATFTADNPQDQYENARVNIYVPENATEDSPIIYMVNNTGWLANIFAEEKDGTALLGGTTASSANSIAATALKNGWVVVNAGLRTRGMQNEDGTYNHSAVTVADAKAVVRYLKHNDAAVLGDADKIFVTGQSGGGALTSALAASGNSEDFKAELEKIGACMDCTDDVLGAIAYCPITDLGHADGAYEYTFAATRNALVTDGFQGEDTILVAGTDLWNQSLALSKKLGLSYTTYVNGLGVAGTNNTFNTETLESAGTLYDTMEALLVDALQTALDDMGETAFLAAVNDNGIQADAKRPANFDFWANGNALKADATITAKLQNAGITVTDGKITDFDLDAYLYYVGAQEILKPAAAFTNEGIYGQLPFNTVRNENSLFGAATDMNGWLSEIVYNELPDSVKANYGTWADYTEKVDVEKQMNMVDSIAYLTSSEGESAPYWWVRHGTVDRDTSFANQTLLFLALDADSAVKTADYAFVFDKGHTGGYAVSDVEKFVKASVEDYAKSQQSTTPEQPTQPEQPTKPTAPKTGDNMLPLLAVVVAAGAVALASTRKRVVR